MSEKTLNTRIQHKHDTEANWLKATNFIPLQGEIIVYDKDDNYSYERLKIGDGETLITELPFITDTIEQSNWDETDETSPTFIKNKPDENDAIELLMEMNFIDPITDENGAIYTDKNGEIFTL